ncbi:MAG: hypothetical protein P4M01_04655 [Acidobacteriota bacterium]|nr:hypothetical protein [Acidobacteriota bacterium]
MAVFFYLPLFASCVALCLGLTLLLITRLPELLTAELKVRLLQIAAFTGIAFLLCTAQWIFALVLIGFVSGWYGRSYQHWLGETSRRSLDQASAYLLAGGIFGLVDSLGWLDAVFHALGRLLRHPVLSVGLVVLVLIALVREAIKKSGETAG